MNLGILDDMTDFMANQAYRPNAVEKLMNRLPVSTAMYVRMQAKRSLKQGGNAFSGEIKRWIGGKRRHTGPRIIPIAGLPKSGTNWLMNLLCLVPGYSMRPVYDPTRAPTFHDVTPLMFNIVPSKGHFVIKLHTRYTPNNLRVFARCVGRFVVIYRDLRDITVSRYFHVRNENSHRHHRLYHGLTRDEALFHCINIVQKEYAPWIEGWRLAKSVYPQTVYQITYEQLNLNVKITMENLLAFFDIQPSEKTLDRMAATQLRKEVDLSDSFASGHTARKGIVGDWRNHFNDEHKQLFKRFWGNSLIELGYEDDYDW